MQVLFSLLTVLFLVASVALIIIILVQRPQGGGLSTAFGGSGAGGGETAFGGRTGDALTVATVTAFVLFLGLAMGLNVVDNQLIKPASAAPAATEQQGTTPAPAVPLTPLPGGPPMAPGTTPPAGAQPAGTTPPTGAQPAAAPAPTAPEVVPSSSPTSATPAPANAQPAPAGTPPAAPPAGTP